MTAEGYRALDDQLKQLKSVERPSVIAAISEARAHGDLSENAEYHAAREQQSFCEGRIQEIEAKLSMAQIIDVKSIPESNRVIFGVTVDLINLETDEAVSYQIVGEDEADIKNSKIYVGSPIARALVGKEVGDVVVVKAPGGEIEYEIDAVRHL